MALTPGARLGPYQILSAIGAGGMGEVYRARDTRLDRDVAIKTLPEAFAADAERVARFQREARLLASLNHPHIGAIYGVEEAGGVRALVLELIEGDTLDDRVRRGPLPVPDALAVAQQIADALDAAHGSGIIHRDLKPSNIKITPDGVVKVLDFGLARAQAGGDSAPELSETMPADGTSVGVILGTAAYMSPEQARGAVLDKRTDIWAFGCVLYQMLTGRLAFAGGTVSDTIAAILEREPDWTVLPVATPPAVRRLMQRCLEKDPRRRLRDIGDARHWMEDAVIGTPGDHAAASRFSRRNLAWLAVGILLVSAGFAGWRLRVSSPDTVATGVQLQRLTDFVGMEESPAISPDGKMVAFVARAGAKRQIWLRLVSGGAPRQITVDDADHEQPRWAPDSSAFIYFVPSPTPGEHGTLWEISALGGEPRRVASALSGADISHDGRHIALFRFDGKEIALVVVARDGAGTDRSRPVPPNAIYEYPRWSPDDRWIAFQQDNFSLGFDKRLFVVSAASGGEPREIARGSDLRGLSWLPGGSEIVYSSSSGSTVLYPAMFSLRAVARDGTGDRQLTFGDVSYVDPDVHMSGLLTGTRIRMQSDIWRFPVDGSPADNTRAGRRITHQTGQAQTPSVSPDGSEVVYVSDSGGHGNLWIARTDGSAVRQITFERNPEISVGVPVWSPVGDQIVFVSTHRLGNNGLSLIHRDGSGLRQFIPVGSGPHWSADGRWVYYSRQIDNGLCIEKAAIAGGPAIRVRCGNARAPAPAADGSTMYFVNPLIETNGVVDHVIRRARPENGPSDVVLDRVAGSRVPVNRRLLVPNLSPDGKWLTMPLTDGTTSNIWALPTAGGSMRPFTDFGDRSIVIGRRVSWSSDSRYLYAAVAETDADIILLDGLLR